MTGQPSYHGNDEEARTTHHPRYHGDDEGGGEGSARQELTARQRWVRIIVIALVVAVFLAIVILHATGSMKGMNG
jgi:hypothetical protein